MGNVRKRKRLTPGRAETRKARRPLFIVAACAAALLLLRLTSPSGDPTELLMLQNPTAHGSVQATPDPAPTQQISPATDADSSAHALSASPASDPAQPSPTFNHRPLKKIGTLQMVVTAYCPGPCCCGRRAHGITAAGYSVFHNGMHLVAADTNLLPFGAILTVPGYNHGQPVPVLDRGGAIKGLRLDVLLPTHEMARRWGKRTVEVDVWGYAD